MSKELQPGQRFRKILWRDAWGTVVRRADDRRVDGSLIEAYTVRFDDGTVFRHWWRAHMRPESRLRFRFARWRGKRPLPAPVDEQKAPKMKQTRQKVGRIRVPKGMKVWQRNDAGEVVEVEVKRAPSLDGEVKRLQADVSTDRPLVAAINRQNAERKLEKLGA